MKELVMICATAVLWCGLAGVAQATPPVAPPMPLGEPFVKISVKPNSVEIGSVSRPGQSSSPAKLEAHIVANCPHHIAASFTALTREGGGGSIAPENTFVAINGINVPVAGAAVPIVNSLKPTPVEGVDFSVKLEVGVGNVFVCPAGTYKATLSLTVMAGP